LTTKYGRKTLEGFLYVSRKPRCVFVSGSGRHSCALGMWQRRSFGKQCFNIEPYFEHQPWLREWIVRQRDSSRLREWIVWEWNGSRFRQWIVWQWNGSRLRHRFVWEWNRFRFRQWIVWEWNRFRFRQWIVWKWNGFRFRQWIWYRQWFRHSGD